MDTKKIEGHPLHIQEDTFILGQWYQELSYGNVMIMALRQAGETGFTVRGRVRFYADGRTFDSADKRKWFELRPSPGIPKFDSEESIVEHVTTYIDGLVAATKMFDPSLGLPPTDGGLCRCDGVEAYTAWAEGKSWISTRSEGVAEAEGEREAIGGAIREDEIPSEMDKSPKVPCKQCPFSRRCEPGALGGSSPAVYIGQSQGSFFLPCHLHTDYDDPNWKVDVTRPQCAGAAIYRANLGVAYSERLLHLPAGHPDVFASHEEFLAHHIVGSPPWQKLRAYAEANDLAMPDPADIARDFLLEHPPEQMLADAIQVASDLQKKRDEMN